MKPMSIAPRQGSGPGPGREVGQAVEQQHDLDHRPGLAPARRRGRRRRARAVRERVGVGEHRAGPDLLARRRARRRRARPSVDQDPLDRRLECAPRAPAASAAARSAAGHRAHPAAGVAPRARRTRPPRRGRGRRPTKAVPGSSGPASVPIRPWIANGTRTASEGMPRQLVGDRPVEDLRADRLEPALAVGRLEQRAGGRASAAASQRCRPRGVRVGVGRRPVARELRVRCARGSTTSPPARPSGNGANRYGSCTSTSSPWRARSRSRDDLRAQQRERVGARRGAHAGPQLLGHARAADDVAPLEHLDVEAGAREVGGGDQAVVAGADDDRVAHRAVQAHAGHRTTSARGCCRRSASGREADAASTRRSHATRKSPTSRAAQLGPDGE